MQAPTVPALAHPWGPSGEPGVPAAKRLRLTTSPTLEDLCLLLPEDVPAAGEVASG
ncbi:hypothetical protein [Saccharopolyspora shandongensis]|uniref:hypothetical protein n=1 Tax=Saccharopolyspora shandongensis TaxID=418495 RepID=UPI0033D74E33